MPTSRQTPDNISPSAGLAPGALQPLLPPATWQRAGAGATRRICVAWPRAKEMEGVGGWVYGDVWGGCRGGGVIASCHPPSFPKLGMYYGYITENTNYTLRQRGAREGTQSNTITSLRE